MFKTQATIAHALEKTKYEDSDAKWKELESKYHFSCQFTADIISMNATDFIITSTYQEIAGRWDFHITILNINTRVSTTVTVMFLTQEMFIRQQG